MPITRIVIKETILLYTKNTSFFVSINSEAFTPSFIRNKSEGGLVTEKQK